MLYPLCVVAGVVLACSCVHAQPVFTLTFAQSLRERAPKDARLVIAFIKADDSALSNVSPHEAPLWDSPQPMLATTLADVGSTLDSPLNDAVFSALNVTNAKDLDGTYRIGARLLTPGPGSATSNWRENDGNFLTNITTVTLKRGTATPVLLTFEAGTTARAWDAANAERTRTQLIEVPSALLSEFHGRPITLRAGVVLPIDYDPARSFGAIYEVPGFGGRHFDALTIGEQRLLLQGKDTPEAQLARDTFWITLDPESPNGHTLFADSANNGPVGKALTTELIPAIERTFSSLRPIPSARLLRGHSSGGWTVLWLATEYPEVFGAAWSTSPDPVDFRRFQFIDLYNQRSFYTLQADEKTYNNPLAQSKFVPLDLASWAQPAVTIGDRPHVVGLGSYRRDGRILMTVAREAGGEDLLGPDNTSGQQWDSWFAVFGPKNAQGHPAALYDTSTGTIDKSIVEAYKKYDISLRLRDNPARYGPLFRSNIRVVVGSADNFYLNEAVSLLGAELGRHVPPKDPQQEFGYIKVLDGLDHGTVLRSREVVGFPAEMLAHVERTKPQSK